MKYSLIFLALFGFLLSNCETNEVAPENITNPEDQINPDSKEGIIALLQEEFPQIELDDVCIDSCYGLRNLYVVGFFAHDRGCGGERYFFKGKEVTMDDNTVKEVLNHSGFKSNMFKVAQSYHEEIINHYEHDLSSKPERFDEGGKEFFPPKVVREGNRIISTMWIQERGGMLPEVQYHVSTVIFDLDGTPIDYSYSDRFRVEY